MHDRKLEEREENMPVDCEYEEKEEMEFKVRRVCPHCSNSLKEEFRNITDAELFMRKEIEEGYTVYLTIEGAVE